MEISEEESYDKEFVDIVTSENWDFDVPCFTEEYIVQLPPWMMVLPAPLEFVIDIIERFKRGDEDNGNDFIG